MKKNTTKQYEQYYHDFKNIKGESLLDIYRHLQLHHSQIKLVKSTSRMYIKYKDDVLISVPKHQYTLKLYDPYIIEILEQNIKDINQNIKHNEIKERKKLEEKNIVKNFVIPYLSIALATIILSLIFYYIFL